MRTSVWRFAYAGPGVRGVIFVGRHPKTFTSTEMSLFNHLVRAGNDGRWHRDAKCLSGPEIDHKFDLRGLLDWQIGRLVALENTSGVDATQTIRIRDTAPVTQ